jgi:hypothetical protein
MIQTKVLSVEEARVKPSHPPDDLMPADILGQLRRDWFASEVRQNKTPKKAALRLFYVGASFADDPTEGDASLGAKETLNQEPAFFCC